jgi:hypothetical protein
MVLAAIQRAAEQARLPWPPQKPVPVPLRDLIVAFNLTHDEVPELRRFDAARYLEKAEIQPPDVWQDITPLAGLLFANANGGYILVNSDDPVPRRRFTAAHELGHFLLHFRAAEVDPIAGFLQEDETIAETDDEHQDLATMERQANLFAAELLMPEAICRQIAGKAAEQGGNSVRYLEHKLAGELLVSHEAAKWRVRALKMV